MMEMDDGEKGRIMMTVEIVSALIVLILLVLFYQHCSQFLDQKFDGDDGLFTASQSGESPVVAIDDGLNSGTLESLKLSRDEALKVHGNLYLMKGEELFALCKVPKNENGIGALVSGDADVFDLYHFGANSVLALGDFPVPEAGPSDQLVSFSSETLTLYPAEFLGFSVPVVEHSYDLPKVLIFTADRTIGLDRKGASQLKVTDAEGRAVWSHYNLKHNETYTVSWVDGDARREVEMKANCRCYRVNREVSYPLGCRILEDGSFVYDLDGVPGGIYLAGTATGSGIVKVSSK
ncbi:hypothetical protein IJH33_00065 [Candidatus Saccharibacteria bacterium]|nr:hypothetical protein [Candidatus Saccharibacteria bacterium]